MINISFCKNVLTSHWIMQKCNPRHSIRGPPCLRVFTCWMQMTKKIRIHAVANHMRSIWQLEYFKITLPLRHIFIIEPMCHHNCSADFMNAQNWARFLSLARSKLRLCLANHRAGYFSNLACDWLSIIWAYSEQKTENGPWYAVKSSKNWCKYR